MIDVRFYDDTHARIVEWARLDFCQRYPRYLNKAGAPDMAHISKAIEICGFVEVNATNIEHVKKALEQRATDRQA